MSGSFRPHCTLKLAFTLVLALSWRPGPSKRSGSRAGRKVGWKAKSFIRGKANCLRRVLLRVNCHKFDTYIHFPSKRHYVFAAAAHLFAPAYLSRPRQVAQARSSRSCLQQVIPLGKRVLPSHFTSTAHSQPGRAGACSHRLSFIDLHRVPPLRSSRPSHTTHCLIVIYSLLTQYALHAPFVRKKPARPSISLCCFGKCRARDSTSCLQQQQTAGRLHREPRHPSSSPSPRRRTATTPPTVMTRSPASASDSARTRTFASRPTSRRT